MNDEKKIIARKIALQVFAETYLLRKENKTLKDQIENFEYGVITDEQEAYMRGYLIKEYEVLGLNLKTEIEKSGEQVPPRSLSNYEIKELKRRADELVMHFSLINNALKKLDESEK